LLQFAAEQQWRFDTTTAAEQRKEQGHFGTPPAIAEYMAGMFTELPHGTVRVLDPGAGVGTLSAAVCERLLRSRDRRHAIFELWENDPQLHAPLRRTMEYCQSEAQSSGHSIEFIIRNEDFVLAHTRRRSLFDAEAQPRFQLVIMNPPYFKLRKASEHARAMSHIVHGQPNIYALFMAVATDLLIAGGEMVAITPRSYFNGPYFRLFRKWYFDRMAARQIHVFESRAAAFRTAEVLQENVILLAEKAGEQRNVVLSSSAGGDFRGVERHCLPYSSVVDDASGDHVIRVATSRLEHAIVDAVDRLPGRFRDLGFEISTGPVVTFRSTEFLRRERSSATAPLLWMHNVRPFVTTFPRIKNGKPTHIIVSDESKRLLLPAKRYVLLKRFTAKEEQRRLVAGTMKPADSYSSWVGLENHLNYVYRPGGELSRDEAFGLAILFNSTLIDRYFRAISGNTQVNAAEIRALPVPDIDTIRRLGRAAGTCDREAQERLVGRATGLPDKLLDELCGSAQ
jgi:adenine-specific DNA-methyltransferase